MNPLPAWVMVNRLRQFHFGRALSRLRTILRSGARPTHPELLDWLAIVSSIRLERQGDASNHGVLRRSSPGLESHFRGAKCVTWSGGFAGRGRWTPTTALLRISAASAGSGRWDGCFCERPTQSRGGWAELFGHSDILKFPANAYVPGRRGGAEL